MTLEAQPASTAAAAEAVHPDLASLAEEVRIVSSEEYALRGERRRIVIGSALEERSRAYVPRRAFRDADLPPLVDRLTDEIYRRLYSRHFRRSRRHLRSAASKPFLAELSTANAGRGHWEGGWRVVGPEDDGRLAVRRSGLTLWVEPESLRSDDGVSPGTECRLRVGKELRHLAAGFYLALGDEPVPGDSPRLGVRLYWHLTWEGAVPFIAAVTDLLNRDRIPFRGKVLRHPDAFERADAGVLYLAAESFPQARPLIAEMHGALRSHLRSDAPLFTQPLALGLGVAESPEDGDSFGYDRCGRVAAALWRAHEAGVTSVEGRGEAIAEAWRAAGLDPARPHLARGSGARYEPLEEKGPGAGSPRRTPGRRMRTRTDLGETALRLGEALCRRAHWHGERCNWVGAGTVAKPPRGWTVAGALGPDLYGGTAGVGLALAWLYARSGGQLLRRTAEGAVLQALARVEGDPPERALSLFNGGLGIACAATKAAELTGSQRLAEGSGRLLDSVLASRPTDRFCDLIGGDAGAILALLSLHRRAGHRRFLVAAEELARDVCRAASKQPEVWSWERRVADGGEPEDPPLAGFSHGAAGIGLALLELHAVSGGPQLLRGARGAFAYEEGLFDAEEGNWPDLRGRSKSPDGPPRYSVFWCHGAPGIALSRLRAIELDPLRRERYAAAAQTGIETTLVELRRRIETPGADLSLCHGVVGLADVVLTAGRAFGEEGWRARAIEAAEVLVATPQDLGDRASELDGGCVGLMMGTAGVAWGLLRLAEPEEVPSILLPVGTEPSAL